MTAIGLGAALVGYLAGKVFGERQLQPPATTYRRYPQLWSRSESSAQRSPMSSR